MAAESGALGSVTQAAVAPPATAAGAAIYRYAPGAAFFVLGTFALLAVPFANAAAALWQFWIVRPEYSHGPMLPVIAAFLIWQQKDRLERTCFPGTWWGVAVTGLALAMFLVGGLGAAVLLQQYALVAAVLGCALALTGGNGARLLVIPLLMLALMIPLPMFVLNNLSAELQLLSSALGVAAMRAIGISVYLEGNVIDLGSYKLQVVEACSGLNYLFPLMVIGFLIAYFYKGALWKRALVFLASVPLAIGMNSLRVAVIGLLVEHWGSRMAEGFLHDFQGWSVFMLSGVMLVGLCAALNAIGPRRGSWRQLFGLEFPARARSGARVESRTLPRSFIASAGIVAAMALLSLSLPSRPEVIPPRQQFAGFPSRVADWVGHPQAIESEFLEVLQHDDYLLSDYRRADGSSANLYVSFYNTQRDRSVVHSPRACIPGGGWHIEELRQSALPEAGVRVNRMLIASGQSRELVYYWFDQRGRDITSELMVKAYLFWDSLTRRRTDGALVRLITPIRSTESVEAAERRLRGFAAQVVPLLPAYIPE